MHKFQRGRSIVSLLGWKLGSIVTGAIITVVGFAFVDLVGVQSASVTARNDLFFVSATGFDDEVLDSTLQTDGKLIIVGKFNNAVGVASRKILRLTLTGNVDRSFETGTGANGDIQSVVIQPDGKIIIAGDFSSFNGLSAIRIARLNSNGALDPTFNVGTGPNHIANAVVLQPDGKILAGGTFTTVNGTSANSIVRLDATGAVDPSFTAPLGITLGGPVNCIAVQADNKILIGGGFSAPGGKKGVARLQADGSLDGTFVGTVSGISTVRSISLTGNTILLGGTFGIIRILSEGAVDATFAASSVSNVMKIAVQPDGKILVCGTTTIGSLGRLNTDGSADPAFTAAEFSKINSLVIANDGSIIGGGKMTAVSGIGGASQAGVRKLNPDGSRDNSYLTRTGAPDTDVLKLWVQPDGKILMMGEFFNVGGLSHRYFARVDNDGVLDETYHPPLTDISALAVQPDGKTIVGGKRFTIDGTFPFYRLNADGTIDPTFNANCTTPTGAGSNVSDIAIQPDGKIVIVGGFTSVNGQTKKGIARLDANGNLDGSFNSTLFFTSATISKVLVRPDGKIIGYGIFQQTASTSRVLFQMKSDGTNEFAAPFAGGEVLSMALQNDGKILVAGTFTSAAAASFNNIARINTDGTAESGFHAPILVGSPHLIRTVLPDRNGKILIGGEFSSVDGAAVVGGFARLNQDGTRDPTFTVSMDSQATVSSLARQADGKLVFSGHFSSVGGVFRKNISRLLPMDLSTICDFDGDSKSDISVFRSANNTWYLNGSQTGFAAFQFGASGDVITPADYTGDGKTDIAVFRQSVGTWFVLRSEDSSFYAVGFGAAGDLPAPEDYDGDGKTDQAVFRPSQGTWYLQQSTAGFSALGFGLAGDQPTAGDFDGDGKADVGVYRSSNNYWYRLNSLDGSFFAVQFGAAGDEIVPADYTGDGKTDVAVWRPSNGTWYVMRSDDLSFYGAGFGLNGDLPVPGDYDGDGKADVAVFRPTDGNWYLLQSASGFSSVHFGTSGDKPTPNAFVY